MRLTLISLTAALIAVTSAQFHTIDNLIVIQPEDVSSDHDDSNNTLVDYVGHDNSSYNSDNKDELDSNDSRAVSANSAVIEVSDDASNDNAPDLSDARPASSSASGEPSGSSLHETDESNESSKSSNAESKTQESSQKTSSSESGSRTRTSEETDEKPVTKESNPGSEDSPETHPPVPPVGTSGEGGGTSRDPADVEKEVNTTHGRVNGYQWPANAEIIAFYDIPYGKFNGPFETPVTAQSWYSVHDITEHTKVCPQLVNDIYTGDENCLTLSIFAPKDADNASVLFHVYDGYSDYTSADPLIYGPDYLVRKGIILVLPNYRTGPMGFLCMQNETALGNAGLKDLSLALEWIKDNINLFGGNPSNIVVSGDGAGGALAGYLAICARSKDYINKVITESGSALSHWALDRDPTGTANQLAEKIRADHSDGVIFNNTFAEVALETIVRAANGMRFKPCIEFDKEPFIDETPWKILQSKEIDTTFMIGSASYAGAHEAIDTTPEFIAQINEDFNILLPNDLVFNNDNEKDEFALKLRKEYFGNDNITASDIKELSLWYTDASYLSPGIRLARPLLSAGATVYLYEFAFVGTLNQHLEVLPEPVPGAVRGDLAGYIFRKDGTTVGEDSPEKSMIELMVDLWVNFMNTGKPAAENVEWNELKKGDDDKEEWLLINTTTELKTGVHLNRLRLWTSLYDHHFIERNSGFRFTPHYLALAAALICLMANKLNYNSQ